MIAKVPDDCLPSTNSINGTLLANIVTLQRENGRHRALSQFIAVTCIGVGVLLAVSGILMMTLYALIDYYLCFKIQ